MSVRFPRWFGVPPELYELRFFRKMSPSGRGLYMTLCSWSDRKSSRQFEVKDADLEDESGLSRRSLHDARKHLSSLGMVQITKKPGGHVYTLCDLRTRLPYPGDPKAKLKWSKNGANGKAVRVDVSPTPSGAQGGAVRAGIAKTQELDPSWRERGAVAAFDVPSKRSSVPSPTDDTTRKYDFDFNFGRNATTDDGDYIPF